MITEEKLPLEFRKNIKELLEDEYSDYIKSFEQSMYKGIRINTNKIKLTDWQEINPFKNLELVPWCEEGQYYQDVRPAKHPYYFAGLYYIQEPSAMAAISFLPINKDDFVLDLCAAPGGKSTQVSTKIGADGILVVNDISFSRARTLEKNIEAFGVKNAMIVSEDPKKLATIWESYFDKIIIDAPCSGEGMFRKDENAIKSWENFDIKYFNKLQAEILESAAKMLKVDGMILYSTCTFSLLENENIIANFLNKHDNFESVPLTAKNGLSNGFDGTSIRLWPHKIKGEGHFICLLKKKYGNNLNKLNSKLYKQLKDYKFVSLFFKENTNMNLNEYVIEKNNKLYLISKNMPEHEKIRTLRSGLYLGDIKQNSFIPSHALCMAYNKDFFKYTINFKSTDIEVIKYLKGETLLENVSNGYYVICVDGFPLGWVKALDNKLKNKYPPNLRMG
ncbi:RNA methyltransferase [Candidatus Epulonipiscioides gigas]|nr:RNA methyltransferase [Epulopiscium sp. SCG-C07WGA-EpuloA2]